MAEFVSIRDLQKDKGQAAAADEEATPQPTAWERFEKTLELADIKIEPEWIVAGTVAATGLAFLLIYAITDSYWWALLAFVIPFVARDWVLRTLKRRRDSLRGATAGRAAGGRVGAADWAQLCRCARRRRRERVGADEE